MTDTQNETIRAAICKALENGPMTSGQLVVATGIPGTKLGNNIKELRRRGRIHRVEISASRWQYSLEEIQPPDAPKRHPTRYSVPVRHYQPEITTGHASSRITVPCEPFMVPGQVTFIPWVP